MQRTSSMIKRWTPLIMISVLSLYLEMAVIRWIAGEVRVFSYFKNLTLLAAFLGLAIGFGLVGRRDIRSAYAPLLAALLIVVLGIKLVTAQFPLLVPGGVEEVFLSGFSSEHWISVILFFGPLSIIFLLVMFLFAPLGQAVGVEMAERPPLPAYAVNVGASLLGVWVFAATSAVQTPPALWFGLASVGMLAYAHLRKIITWSSVTLQLVVLVGLAVTLGGSIWSPYQKLLVSEVSVHTRPDGPSVPAGYQLDTQVGFHQHAYNLSPGFLSTVQGGTPDLPALGRIYDLPYTFIKPGADILIVGAGMGNDVAAALRAEVGHVDAVEIDPRILALGAELHPEHPYDDPRVRAMVDDARSFIQRTDKQYDAIVFGLLDSHTLLSGISGVRLDSYVYTEQAFAAVQQRLKDGGIVSVTFLTVQPWIEDRLGRILAREFGADRVWVSRSVLGTTYIVGPIEDALAANAGLARWEPDPALDQSPVPTDDWPYLYLRSRSLPAVYWEFLVLIGIIVVLIMARSFPMLFHPDWHFWFLGAAFLLIEFKSITELALLFGTTWLVNAIAISGVLVMIMLANAVVLRSRRIKLHIAFPLLILSLVLLYILPLQSLNTLDFLPRLILGGSVLSLPLFFSGLIFGESIRRAGETSRPLASNLAGSMAGGMLEYGSLVWGVKSLYLMAVGLYLAAWLALRLRGRSS
jgi:hypothetical protein